MTENVLLETKARILARKQLADQGNMNPTNAEIEKKQKKIEDVEKEFDWYIKIRDLFTDTSDSAFAKMYIGSLIPRQKSRSPL